jgi:leucyl-tRNA synthetase
MSPIVPHFSEELWSRMGHAESIFQAGWPEADEDIAQEDELEIPIQVNGKVKARMKVAAGISNEDLEKAAMDNADLQKHIEGKTVRKVIVVPGKLVNIAVS